MTPYATGAKIKDTVNEALINAIRDGREVITWADIIKAKQLKEHGLADDFQYVEHERHAIAVHEACHAVAVGTLCVAHRMIDVATIERRGDVGGFVSYVPPEDRFTQWRSEYNTDIQVSLASLAGERMLFEGDNSSGVGGDMRYATRLATLMVGYWAMGSTFTSHAVRREFGIGGGGGGGGAARRRGRTARRSCSSRTSATRSSSACASSTTPCRRCSPGTACRCWRSPTPSRLTSRSPATT